MPTVLLCCCCVGRLCEGDSILGRDLSVYTLKCAFVVKRSYETFVWVELTGVKQTLIPCKSSVAT